MDVLLHVLLAYRYIYIYLKFIITAKEIDKKLRNLRTQYTREKQKKRKPKSGDGVDDVTTEPKWVHFNSLRAADLYIECMQVL